MARERLKGVMFNAYPDSIGERLSDSVSLLERDEFKDVFSLFYILPTFFNSDLDRGFSIIDYDVNQELVAAGDLERLKELGIKLKFDLVLNHLSVASPQFEDLLENGDDSEFIDFFIDWNEFWKNEGELSRECYVVPKRDHLDKLFMRKPGLPILFVRFPDGSERPYWNTFYQKVVYQPLTDTDVAAVGGISEQQLVAINDEIQRGAKPADLSIELSDELREQIVLLLESKRSYLGQMDINAKSPLAWEFYDETFAKLKSYGATLIRLDAFAYLHKEIGEKNFFNKPGTWEYLARLKDMAAEYDLIIFPEIHSEYGKGLHEEVAGEGFPIYDFFLPGLLLDAIDRGVAGPLVRWIEDIQAKGLTTINMLGCHDGIPVLDLKGEAERAGLLSDQEIDGVIDRVLERGGRVKNLYGPDGKKISYYQVNATYFSALGESEEKLLLARAMQLFTPGIPQVWYLDLFAGTNDYAAADSAGEGGHKEINRTTLSLADVEAGLEKKIVQDQLALLRLRNTHPAFEGKCFVTETDDGFLEFFWEYEDDQARLVVDLKKSSFSISHSQSGEWIALTF